MQVRCMLFVQILIPLQKNLWIRVAQTYVCFPRVLLAVQS